MSTFKEISAKRNPPYVSTVKMSDRKNGITLHIGFGKPTENPESPQLVRFIIADYFVVPPRGKEQLFHRRMGAPGPAPKKGDALYFGQDYPENLMGDGAIGRLCGIMAEKGYKFSPRIEHQAKRAVSTAMFGR